MSDLKELESKLRGLLKGEHCSLSIQFNDHQGPNYMTAAQFEEYYGPEKWCGDWVSEEQHQKALATNSVWEIHWYPDTPVGFCAFLGADLEAVITAALDED